MESFKQDQTVNTICKAIVNSEETIKVTKTWRVVNEELGIGRLIGRVLHLTAEDRNQLRRHIENEFDMSPEAFLALSPTSRIEASEHRLDEKRGVTGAISKEYICLKSTDNKLLLDQEYGIPEKSYLTIVFTEAILHRHATVIIIENLDTFLQSERINWPQGFKTSNHLLVYRGDVKNNPAAVNKFLQQQSADVYAFMDFDPAGLKFAFALYRQQGLIIPDLAKHSIEILKQHSREDKYIDQFYEVQYLTKLAKEMNDEVIDVLLKHKLAVQQERMVSQKLPLVLWRMMKKSGMHA